LSALSFLKDATLSEEYALRKGFLQSLDPRVKAFTFLALLLTVVSLKNAAWIGLVYFFCLVLVRCSKISVRYFLVRTWVFITLFSLCIAIPALFSSITPGEPIWFFHIFGIQCVITHPGLDTAVLFVTRVATSVSLVVLLSLTTRHAELLAVLRLFGIPQIFILTTAMCYRYLYLFAEMIENTFTAVKSRVGTSFRNPAGRKVVAWNMATMWSRSSQMNEDVYRAMLSKGYTGRPRLLTQFKLRRRDWAWLLLTAGFIAGLIFWRYKICPK
jgi:cobalt/nickel transport system permease protein